MIWHQTTIELTPLPRGFHLVTNEVLAQAPDLTNCEVGLLHLFIQHTSASLAVNENADPDVRSDLERHFNVLAPENAPHYQHTMEGPDDMPAHIKSLLIGPSLTLPVSHGHLALGTWQGIYLTHNLTS
ncbi:MAG: hypothetical protein B7X58_15565 [Marinobacter sp. 34-60-7]|nr:MAG: hypothetical protein B7X58_15565 [Marinobacter sp. 34-60-7]